MREAVDGIRSSKERYGANPTQLSTIVLRFGQLLAILCLVVGVGSSVIAVGDDATTLHSLQRMVPSGHYLVLFQNNAELRPSGGFIGSFAVVDIAPMGVTRFVIDTNIYKRDNAFTEQHAIQPPVAFAENMSSGLRWAMRDSNWDLDFRDAAQRVAWFYEQEGGEAVDGVVAVNASVVQDVLRLTGPVTVPQLDQPLSADTFFVTLAKEVEQDYFKDPTNEAQNEPKSILKDIVRILEGEVKKPAIALRLPSLLRGELDQKHVQLFHNDPTVEQHILQAGWGGEIEQNKGDYLLVNNASVAGMKSSLNIEQETDLAVTRLPDATTKHVLTITRTHTGSGVWPDYRNNNYVRIAVPNGSVLQDSILNGQSVRSVDTTVEAGKTVFGTRFDTDPGHTAVLQLTYVVPLTQQNSYMLDFQKQSGVLRERLRVALDGKNIFENAAVKTDMLINE